MDFDTIGLAYKHRIRTTQHQLTKYVSKNGHPFYFCYNFVSCDQILVIFGSTVARKFATEYCMLTLKNCQRITLRQEPA